MKRFKLLGLTLMSGVALVTVFAGSAIALPELTGQVPSAEYTGKNTVANPTLETTKEEKVVCKEAASDGIQETGTLGTFHVHLTGCKSSGFACSTSGDEAGIILSLGSFHYVYDHLGSGSELGIAILFLFEEQTIKCTALVTLKVRGTVLCLVSEPFTYAPTHEFSCAETKGVPSETTWWNDEAAEQHAKLETSKNGGAFIESGEQASASLTFGTEVSFKPPILVAVTPEIRVALNKGEENKSVYVVFENSSKTSPIELQKDPAVGGDLVSWSLNAPGEQLANVCKNTLKLAPNGTCSVRMTFASGAKAKKEGAGNGYVATVTETAKGAGSATSKLNGEVTN